MWWRDDGVMVAGELVQKIQRRYGDQLDRLAASLASPAGRQGPDNGPDWRPPSLGPVRSLTDQYADITLGADVSDYAWYAEDPTASGDLMTVSLAAHHRLMRSRTGLAEAEADAWALAVLGTEHASLIYRAGALSGVRGFLTTVYYHLYRDASGGAALLPEGSRVAERAARMTASLT